MNRKGHWRCSSAHRRSLIRCQDKAGMPIGVQMIGNCFGEHKIFRAAAAYEAERGVFPTPLKGGREA